jgi:tRNA (cytidine/uridine-2'-O-)-methyltransferase
MDYLALADIRRADSWRIFLETRKLERIVLLSTKASTSYLDFEFKAGDILLLGRETSGVPANVQSAVHHQVCIPLKPPARSLNVALAAAIVASEALRQTGC